MDQKIENWRADIDRIDQQLLRLLNERALLAAGIGRLKRQKRAPLCDPDREARVLAEACEANRGPLDDQAIKKVFKTIIDESLRIQSRDPSMESSSTAHQMPERKSADVIWNRVTIVGCGLIGASFAQALKQSGTCGTVAGWDIAKDVLADALRSRIIDEIDSSFVDGAVSQSDLIYLAMPVSGIIDFLRERGKQIKRGALLTDAGSTKVEICRAAQKFLPKEIVFVGGHPVAGSQHSGIQYADGGLFDNRSYVLIKDGVEPDRVRLFNQTLDRIGARVKFMTADEHDRAMAFISHVPQILSSTLAALISGEPDAATLLDLSGSGFRDMTRLAGSSWSIWRDVLETNHVEIGNALGAIAQRLETVRAELCAPSKNGKNKLVQASRIFTVANLVTKVERP